MRRCGQEGPGSVNAGVFSEKFVLWEAPLLTGIKRCLSLHAPLLQHMRRFRHFTRTPTAAVSTAATPIGVP